MKEQKHKIKKEEFTISKLVVWKTISAILAILIIISIYTNGFGLSPTRNAAVDEPDHKDNEKGDSAEVTNLMDDDAIEGDLNAPVTIVEWSDYQCPYCTRFYSQTYKQIVKEYIDTGKVKFVFRDFPLSFHKNAQKAAEAAECAGEQDKYYDMYDKLFGEGVVGGVTTFKKYAEEIGLNTIKFNECLDSGMMVDEIKKDIADGQSVGVKGTPAFMINGKLITGAQPFNVFKKAIDAELNK